MQQFVQIPRVTSQWGGVIYLQLPYDLLIELVEKVLSNAASIGNRLEKIYPVSKGQSLPAHHHLRPSDYEH